jgi:hypothetical protein
MHRSVLVFAAVLGSLTSKVYGKAPCAPNCGLAACPPKCNNMAAPNNNYIHFYNAFPIPNSKLLMYVLVLLVQDFSILATSTSQPATHMITLGLAVMLQMRPRGVRVTANGEDLTIMIVRHSKITFNKSAARGQLTLILRCVLSARASTAVNCKKL